MTHRSNDYLKELYEQGKWAFATVVKQEDVAEAQRLATELVTAREEMLDLPGRSFRKRRKAWAAVVVLALELGDKANYGLVGDTNSVYEAIAEGAIDPSFVSSGGDPIEKAIQDVLADNLVVV